MWELYCVEQPFAGYNAFQVGVCILYSQQCPRCRSSGDSTARDCARPAFVHLLRAPRAPAHVRFFEHRMVRLARHCHVTLGACHTVLCCCGTLSSCYTTSHSAHRLCLPFPSLFAQLMNAVVTEGEQLVFPLHCPAPYARLAQDCMSRTPTARPTMQAVVARIEALLGTGHAHGTLMSQVALAAPAAAPALHQANLAAGQAAAAAAAACPAAGPGPWGLLNPGQARPPSTGPTAPSLATPGAASAQQHQAVPLPPVIEVPLPAPGTRRAPVPAVPQHAASPLSSLFNAVSLTGAGLAFTGAGLCGGPGAQDGGKYAGAFFD